MLAGLGEVTASCMLTSREYDSRDLIELSDTEGEASLFTVKGWDVEG